MKNRLRSIALTLALTLPLTLIYAQSFPGLNWSYALPAPSFGSAASADVDEDGFLEIIFTTYTADGKAHCLNAEFGDAEVDLLLHQCPHWTPVVVDAFGWRRFATHRCGH